MAALAYLPAQWSWGRRVARAPLRPPPSRQERLVLSLLSQPSFLNSLVLSGDSRVPQVTGILDVVFSSTLPRAEPSWQAFLGPDLYNCCGSELTLTLMNCGREWWGKMNIWLTRVQILAPPLTSNVTMCSLLKCKTRGLVFTIIAAAAAVVTIIELVTFLQEKL